MTRGNTNTLLERFVQGLRDNSQFMSHALLLYQEQENLSIEELAAELGAMPAMLTRLALCKRPDHASPRFAEQVREIADYTLLDEAQLANLLRQVEAVERLAKRPIQVTHQQAEAELTHPLSGLLAAARDRDEHDQEQNSQEQTETEK